jgi:hypothetical protein
MIYNAEPRITIPWHSTGIAQAVRWPKETPTFVELSIHVSGIIQEVRQEVLSFALPCLNNAVQHQVLSFALHV